MRAQILSGAGVPSGKPHEAQQPPIHLSGWGPVALVGERIVTSGWVPQRPEPRVTQVVAVAENQNCQAHVSSTESEYVAPTDVTKEVVFLRELLEFLLPQRRGPLPVFEDDGGATKLAKSHL